jgi:DNA-binding MarR family transcriptional regulator
LAVVTSKEMTKFTNLQGQYLAFLDAYAKVSGRPPAEADLQRHFKVTPPTVHQTILTLARLGLITRSPGQARAIRLNVWPEEIPRLE